MKTCDNLRAVVTGGSRGIGYAIAHELMLHGATLSICARGAAGLEQAAARVMAVGGHVHSQALDVADGDALRRWVDEASAEAMGGLDIVVHSASAMFGEGDAAWEANLAVDVLGASHLVSVALPFIEQSSAAASW